MISLECNNHGREGEKKIEKTLPALGRYVYREYLAQSRRRLPAGEVPEGAVEEVLSNHVGAWYLEEKINQATGSKDRMDSIESVEQSH